MVKFGVADDRARPAKHEREDGIALGKKKERGP